MKTIATIAVLFAGMLLCSVASAQDRATTSELPAALMALQADHNLALSSEDAHQIRGEGGAFCPSTKQRHIKVPTSSVIHVVGEKNKVDLKGTVFTSTPVINILGEKNKVSLKGAVYFGTPIINVVGVKNKVKVK